MSAAARARQDRFFTQTSEQYLFAFDDRDDVALDGAGVRPDQDFRNVLAGEWDDVVRYLFSLLCQVSLFRCARQ
jgi:hypothetical protein